MNENKKKRKNQNIVQMIILFVSGAIGGVIGYFGGMYLEKLGISGINWIYVLAGIVLICYLQIILHEVGHLVCGWISGYHFVSFRIGNLILYKSQGRLHLGRYALAGTAGQCLMAPPEMVEGKIPYKLYNLGGAMMNLLLAVIAAVLYFAANPNIVTTVIYVSCMAVGLLFALTNGIPMRLGVVDNDGYNAISLGKNPEALRAFWLQLKVNESLTEGIHLKDMPREWFEKPSEEGVKNSMIAAIEAMRCNRLLDEMKFEEANKEIDAVLNSNTGMVGVQEMLLRVDQIFCELLGEKREEILNRMQDKNLRSFMNSMKTFPSVARTRYAYALLVGQDEKKSAKWKKRFEKSVKKYPCRGEVESEWQFIGCCEAELEANTK